MHNSLGEMSHRFGKNGTEAFVVRRQRSVQEIEKKHPVYSKIKAYRTTYDFDNSQLTKKQVSVDGNTIDLQLTPDNFYFTLFVVIGKLGLQIITFLPYTLVLLGIDRM